MSEVHPALILLAGGLLLFALPTTPRRIVSVLLPVLGFLNLLTIADGTLWHITWGGYELTILRADRLSMLFGYLFHLAAFIGAIYALHLKDRLQIGTGLIYAGSAVGAVFAGDLITLFIFWELLAITSVFLVWARGGERALRSGMRYLVMHISSGLLLLLGAVFYYLNTKSLTFDHIGLDESYHYLIFFAFGIKCAFPLLHNWLIDAYPESTPVGTVFLSAFTTKAAVYALARGFAGEDLLIYIGAIMTIFPIFYAAIENDMRRVLSYSMINQIGFMVAGIGIGGALGINGAVSHAFNDVLFKGLLFMSMGAVLFSSGRINASDLGGLYKSMPWTCACCIIGAASISAIPLFNAFISKSMVMQGVAGQRCCDNLAGTLICIGRRASPRRRQNSIFFLLRARLWNSLFRSTPQHAGRHDHLSHTLYRHRLLSTAALQPVAASRRLRALYHDPCRAPTSTGLLRSTGICGLDVDQ